MTGEERTALLVLVSGRFRVELPGRSVLLAEQGDYVVWGRGVDHSLFAEEESRPDGPLAVCPRPELICRRESLTAPQVPGVGARCAVPPMG
ncbi:hypothetical protein RKD21_000376 [Streptomyces albogriseolus]|uniref:Uncharacterized protein n=1 Tax=Streptomyces albogriseolus TaxID=1887 RepID=A0ACC6UFN7_STRAO